MENLKIKQIQKNGERVCLAVFNAELPDFSGSNGTVAWLRPGVCDGGHDCGGELGGQANGVMGVTKSR
jgi:hypothetical protein